MARVAFSIDEVIESINGQIKTIMKTPGLVEAKIQIEVSTDSIPTLNSQIKTFLPNK
jgi:hypothetical protein